MAFKVAFRLDAGAEIGLGHLMRCLAIADRLKTPLAPSATFSAIELPAHLLSLLRPHHHHPLCALDDAGALAPPCSPSGWCVDHYQIDHTDRADTGNPLWPRCW